MFPPCLNIDFDVPLIGVFKWSEDDTSYLLALTKSMILLKISKKNCDCPDNHDDNSDSDEDHPDRNNLHSKCDL